MSGVGEVACPTESALRLDPEPWMSPSIVRNGLIAVVLILAVAVAACVEMIVHMRHRERSLECKNRLSIIHLYFTSYASRYQRYPIPGRDTWFDLLCEDGGIGQREAFICPATPWREQNLDYWGLIGPGRWSPFGNGAGWGANGDELSYVPGDLPIVVDGLRDGTPNHAVTGERNVLQLSGHVYTWEPGKGWEPDYPFLGPCRMRKDMSQYGHKEW